MTNTQKIDKILEAHFKDAIPPRIARLARLANNDLYTGPTDDEEWEGFSKATDEITAWARENLPIALWVDIDCDTVSEREPEAERCFEHTEDTECKSCGAVKHCEWCNGTGWVEPFTENTYEVERKDIKRALFGSELASYV